MLNAVFERSTRPATDKIDARILRVLQSDGRISNLKLAEAVHLSPTAVMERVKRLKRDGFILGVHARLNPDKLGRRMAAFVEVQLDRAGADVMRHFTAAVHERPEVLECHLIAGGFDYLLKVRVSDGTDWQAQVADLVEALPAVRQHRSYVVREQLKHGHAIVL
jgi:Lrp/AsnC family transcriptional regulator, leucine-responsive regulatory protein